MKKTIRYNVENKTVEREVNYIPVRFIIAIMLTLFEVLAVIGIVVALCYYIPYFYLAAWVTEIFCVIRIIASDDNPDYKVPWLLFVLIIPIGINVRRMPTLKHNIYPSQAEICEQGYIIPFGDGPHPIYERRVGKSVIQNMLAGATRYAWMTTPYLIIDNDLCTDLENTALRGVDVRIIVPHIPDKKLVFGITQSFYHRLLAAGVRIYEYEPGFVHAKSYLVDDELAMIGTINLDYRSLVHHFENGVWMYKCEAVKALKTDILDTLDKCIEITPDRLKANLLERFIRAVVRIFAPML